MIILKVLLLTAVLFISSCCEKESKPTRQDLINNAMESSVIITVQDVYLTQESNVSIGSGFVATNTGYVITNAHVVNDMLDMMDPEVNIKFANGYTAHPTEVYASNQYDIALLKIKEDKKHLNISPKEPQVGDFVFTIANSYPYEFSASFGRITYIERITDKSPDLPLLQSSLDLFKGCSGSPLLDVDGNVIGVNQSVWGDRQGISLSVPSLYIIKILNGEIAVEQYR